MIFSLVKIVAFFDDQIFFFVSTLYNTHWFGGLEILYDSLHYFYLLLGVIFGELGYDRYSKNNIRPCLYYYKYSQSRHILISLLFSFTSFYPLIW